MANRITPILVVICFVAVILLTFSSVFLSGLRPPTGSGAIVPPSVGERAGE